MAGPAPTAVTRVRSFLGLANFYPGALSLVEQEYHTCLPLNAHTC